ncbi:protein CURVATURE THYLAKOID 1B, chloroplastic-like [Typha angustifolia]|uniref:protein CURVATURE THYLAKOID 1B, chloroplastic-like n=1 Tax=Typha angustifolia TaxID=59011 RepID=UPI003C2C55DB
MATSIATTCGLTSPALADGKSLNRHQSPHCVALPSPFHVPSLGRCHSRRRTGGDVIVMATGETQVEVSTELPEIVKTAQDAWDKLEDKYAVTTLLVAGVIALWTATGMISAIDRLPVVPGVLELVGIGYTGWFAYNNLVFKPDREALIAKVKSAYGDIIGSK